MPDPFEIERWPEDVGEDEAGERIHELLRGYERGDLLGGWVLFHTWVNEDGDVRGGWNTSPDLDFFRAMGIARAGELQIERAYMQTERVGFDGDEDED